MMAFASLLAAVVSLCASPSLADNEVEERMFLAQFMLGGEIEARSGEESKRLLDLCKVYDSVCFAKHFSEVRRRVAILRKGPHPSDPPIGYVVAVLKVEDYRWGGLEIGLDIETADVPPRTAEWLQTVGDWGYGIHISGVRPRGEWIQLFGLPLIGDGWVSASEPDFRPFPVTPLTHQIIELQALVATFPDGSERQIPAGSYLVLRVSPGRIEFRQEIATDFSCGQPTKAPLEMPPLLKTTPAEFFNADRTPRFATKYQRGC